MEMDVEVAWWQGSALVMEMEAMEMAERFLVSSLRRLGFPHLKEAFAGRFGYSGEFRFESAHTPFTKEVLFGMVGLSPLYCSSL
jgi:hypothetical protein